jgi:hypothetical protein
MPKVRATSAKVPLKRAVAKRASSSGRNSGNPASTTAAEKMAQVRLRADEAAALNHTMQVLHIPSTSEALREGLRLLHREAAETQAADNIRAFYQGQPAPLPEGVMPVDEADLRAADEAEW